jgi:cytosine deaminase
MKLFERYWLRNAHIPVCLLEGERFVSQTREGLALVDLKIADGVVIQIVPSPAQPDNLPEIDLKKRLIFPRLIDLHTHLDKSHIWERSPNSDGTFERALTTVKQDTEKYWQAEDVLRRMEFSLQCSYAHGTAAIRTHIDAAGKQGEISFGIFQDLQESWSERLIMQAVSLVSLDYYQTNGGIALADKIAEIGGILGGVAYMNQDLDNQLDTIFSLAKERNLNLDFHADENGDPHSICLQKIAEAALRNEFNGNILCGHCCSLAVQPPAIVSQTLDLVKQAGIAIVSLPSCNLFLQDRHQFQTPYWRGITKVHELKQAGIPVAFASDNCRDPFYGFGDGDVLEVLSQAVKIGHLDAPYSDWCASVTLTAADLMGLPQLGRIKTGMPADLIIFTARYFSELFSRPQGDRLILHWGKIITATLPDYAELDALTL